MSKSTSSTKLHCTYDMCIASVGLTSCSEFNVGKPKKLQAKSREKVSVGGKTIRIMER
jgi:hypothetical protein